MHYYSENDPHAAQWMRNLMDADLIPKGVVDERSITDVTADDLRGFTSCHFFAGIAGWPLALRLAGWPDDRPVWTGSCPCQPFSAAGKRKGTADERHMWPEFYRLIQECRPQTIFGEQVASSEVVGTQLEVDFIVAVQTGDYARANLIAKRLVASRGFHFDRRWLDGVHADLAAANYSMRFKVLGAHSVGAPHIRQRLFWVANAGSSPPRDTEPGIGLESNQRRREAANQRGGHRSDSRVGVAHPAGPQGRSVPDSGRGGERAVGTTGGDANHWSDYVLIPCRDEKARRIEPGLEPLVNGVPFRLADGRTRDDCSRAKILKGIGNAIVPQVATEFIKAFCGQPAEGEV